MYNMNNHSNSNVSGANKIILCAHCKERAFERLNISSEKELRKMAANARNKGIKYNAVHLGNYEKLGMNYREFCSFVCSAKTRSNSEKIYLYKDYVWVFRGGKGLNLITVFKMKMLERVPEEMGEMRKNENRIVE